MREVQVARSVRRGQDQGAPAVGHQATFEQVDRIGDQPRPQHVIDGDRVAHHGTGVHRGPLALSDRHRRQLLVGESEVLHVPHHADREHARGSGGAIGALELGGQGGAVDAPPAGAHARPAGLAVGDEHQAAHPGGQGGGGVAYVDHERTTAHRRSVQPAGCDPEVVGDRDRALPGAGNAVDRTRIHAAVGDGVASRVGVQVDGRHVGNAAELGRLGGADDGDDAPNAHRADPAGRNCGNMISPRSSNVTSSGMSTTRFSGVFSTSRMLDIRRGPSSSWTTAMA